MPLQPAVSPFLVKEGEKSGNGQYSQARRLKELLGRQPFYLLLPGHEAVEPRVDFDHFYFGQYVIDDDIAFAAVMTEGRVGYFLQGTYRLWFFVENTAISHFELA